MLLPAFTIVLAAALAPQPAVTPVPSVDLTRYQGVWYEVARFPNRFQEKCAADVTATYALRRDGRIDVVNRCRRQDGMLDDAAGVAKRVGDSTSRLKVRFAPAFLSFLPNVWGDYWILGLAPDYGYAVVGDPDRRYLWILSRAPSLDEARYSEALETARKNGFDVTRLVKTRQTAAGG